MRALIAGAARAIGAATARVLDGRGFEVVVTARQPELLAEVPAALRLLLDATPRRSWVPPRVSPWSRPAGLRPACTSESLSAARGA